MKSPIRPTDDDARTLARSLIESARFAGLAYTDKADGLPMISRVALVAGPEGMPLSLMSDLSHHSAALQHNPLCALLIGEPKGKGDPLTHPRLSLRATAHFVRHGEAERADLAIAFLSKQPKAKLYIGFADFALVRFTPLGAHLNGGFGKAYVLTADDLAVAMR
ncbi:MULTISPECIES: HugZ family protein [Marivita]|uniref:Pyridoxamine 5'-phosphate oxidase family protein n=1 Tax=Marivita cryptomonadis TaxID=505252 RepID=A0A9Q2RWN6_9RHOB|nr:MULTISPECIES: pyridoxamine 5'-phosphate oxidase family protein [Marivita]MCR9169946.1 pyridoxamine 5'-phosphate oxidase family protein [Paracoccaceae bacterium]MBM2321091.1 pyridoxamine 5'-phosphate oxidase family protein [Marivita cryptomonadis]MBM2330672.1 pyridoxamine 5'-phosphate oxidase family protein [Marivita cryptomonadis]MBM2340258.1 pyridoxamine 5'-phosphate oxidase family protein [Marivita cryptomonadis]MBM2344920.1 pyridoxamine 5'-phosphate oxidase family protein [Marivita crypt